jgi:hypothetical protein
MIVEQLKECAAMMMIGDGVLAVVEPHGHLRVWERGPSWWQALMRPFADRPGLTRLVGASEVALGVWLAARQAKSLDRATGGA